MFRSVQARRPRAIPIPPALPLFLVLLFLIAAIPLPVCAWEWNSSQAQNVALLGQVGGACRAMALSGDRVFIGQGPRVTEVDLSNPRAPQARSSFLLPGLVQAICAFGDTAFVLADDVWILDISDRQAFRELARLPVHGRQLATDGNYLYVAGDTPDLQVIDVRELSHPRLIATFSIDDEREVTIRGTQILLQDRYAFLCFTLQYHRPDVPLMGGVAVVDLTDPKSPQLKYTHFGFSSVSAVALRGSTIYAGFYNWIQVLDVSDPRVPLLKQEIAGPGFLAGIAIEGDRVYAVGAPSNLWSYQIQAEGILKPIRRGSIAGEPAQIAFRDGRLVVADGWAGLRLFDFATTLSAPAEVGALSEVAQAGDVAIDGEYAYVADAKAGLRVFDLADRDHPRQIAQYFTSGSTTAVRLAGSLAYVANAEAGLEIVDVADPRAPRRVAALALPGPALDVTVYAGYAIVAAGEGGLVLVRIVDPRHPVVFGRFPDCYAVAVAVDIDHAYVCDGAGLGIKVIEITSPAYPVFKRLVTTLGSPRKVEFDGKRLAVAETDHGLSLYDVTRRYYPEFLGAERGPGWYQGLALGEDLAYVADSMLGLRVINVADSRHPSRAGFLATPGRAQRVALAHGRAYLAAGEGGLYVLRYSTAPDLEIEAFDYQPDQVLAGDELFVQGTIRNLSPTTATTGVWVDLAVSKSRYFRKPYRLLCPRLRLEPGMLAGPVNLADHRFVVLKTVPPGIYTLGIIVDADNELSELREDNNVLWHSPRRIYVGPGVSRAKSWTLYK
jgi:hypothetical protein